MMIPAYYLQELIQYRITDSIIQYQYMIIYMAILNLLFCHYSTHLEVKNLAAVAMLLIIINFTIGIFLHSNIMQSSINEVYLYAITDSSKLTLFLINIQILLGFTAYLMMVLAFYLDE